LPNDACHASCCKRLDPRPGASAQRFYAQAQAIILAADARIAQPDVHSTAQGAYKPRPAALLRPEISGRLTYCISPRRGWNAVLDNERRACARARTTGVA
jgi:hypothetical protein